MKNTTPFEDEPSLHDIKKLLINIQTTVSGISKEIQDLLTELTDLRNLVAFYDQELQENKTNLAKASAANASLGKDLDDTKKKLKQTNKLLDEEMCESQKLWDSSTPLSSTHKISGDPQNSRKPLH